MNHRYRELGGYIDEAIDHLIYNGWPNHESDFALAEIRYREWIESTGGMWFQHGWRDREILFQNIRLDMTSCHDDAASTCYALLLMLMLEMRADDDDPDGAGLIIFRARLRDED